MKWSFWKKKEERTRIVERSNIIQYDDMGYPLRLCIMSDRRQAWIDTDERDGDIVLRWEEVAE